MNEPETITFQRVTPKGANDGDPLKVKINPTEVMYEKAVQLAEIGIPGLDSPILQFVRGQSETVSLELFFDTTDKGMAGDKVQPVTEETDQFYQLIKIDRETHAPPILQVSWGEANQSGTHMSGNFASQNRTAFQCVVESVQQRFTLFSPEGTPLRATLSVKLKEFYPLDEQIQKINFRSGDRTRSWIVKSGDTLSGIAGELYSDPGKWRPIADHNQLEDPLRIEPGLVLQIPSITQTGNGTS